MVEVRAPAEILATLDGDASVDAMPFMPEMLQHAGKRFTVSSRVEKICDTVSGEPPRSLRMRDTVLLDDLRCEGSAHGGCQAGCRLYWKEEWLRRVDPASESDGSESGDDHADALARLEQLAREATVAAHGADGTSVETYRCQATEALRASEPLRSYDLRQYRPRAHLRERGGAAPASRRLARHQHRRPAPTPADRPASPPPPGGARPDRRVSSTCNPAIWWRCAHRRRSRPASTRPGGPEGSGSTGR